MPFAERAGVKIYFEDTGGDGDVVFLTHGFGSSSATWDGQMELVKNFRIVRWDMRGHGLSDSPKDPAAYSKRHQVDDMMAVLDACEVPCAVFVGHSMGGFDSMLFQLCSAQHAQRMKALVVVSAGPGFGKAEAREKWNQRAAAMAADFGAKGLEALVGSDRNKGHTDEGARIGLAHSARRVFAQLDDDPLLSTLPNRAGVVITHLPQLKSPMLIVVGERDKAFRGAADMMAAKVPASQCVVIAGAGHMVHEVQQDRFNAVLSDFLQSVALPSSKL